MYVTVSLSTAHLSLFHNLYSLFIFVNVLISLFPQTSCSFFQVDGVRLKPLHYQPHTLCTFSYAFLCHIPMPNVTLNTTAPKPLASYIIAIPRPCSSLSKAVTTTTTVVTAFNQNHIYPQWHSHRLTSPYVSISSLTRVYLLKIQKGRPTLLRETDEKRIQR